MQTDMQNIHPVIWGNTLILTIDLAGSLGPTKSGKSTNVAMTRGYRRLEVDRKLGLNLHLWSTKVAASEQTPPQNAVPSSPEDSEIRQLTAIASGLSNPQREKLVRQINEMIERDSTI